MENSKVDHHLDWLLRNHQIDLSGIERERLEQITIGLLRGQVLVFEELAQETRQSQVIGAQQQLHNDQQNQLAAAQQTINNLSTAVAGLEENSDHYYKATILLLADLVMRSWVTEGREQAQEILLTGLWRAVAEAIQNGDIEAGSPAAKWWIEAARSNFGFPTLGETPQEETSPDLEYDPDIDPYTPEPELPNSPGTNPHPAPLSDSGTPEPPPTEETADDEAVETDGS